MRRNYLHAYAIVRYEADWESSPIDRRITVKKVVFDPEYAASEVQRLNELKRGKESYYFSHITRIEQPFAVSESAVLRSVPQDAQVSNQIIIGRIRLSVEVDGRKCWTLFDSGAQYSYITRDAAARLDLRRLPHQRRSSLAGRVHNVYEVCLVLAEIEGHPLEFQAAVLDQIGVDEDGRTIDVLFGVIAMQLWGIRLDRGKIRLDFSHFTTDFVEF